jgi:alkylation response protein AidB-like acyl-CoA dehydrogenase
MDFTLTEDQLMMRQTIREFAKKEVKPLSKELDARTNPMECISWELIKKAADLGIRLLGIPKEWGGLGADIITRLIIQEELGAADVGFADLMRDHGVHLFILGKEQRNEFLPQYLADYRYFIAHAQTEPDHGTDHLMGYDEPEASMETFAEKRGNEYIINGTKQFVSHAPIAKLYIIYARTDRKLPLSQCQSGFLVPRDTPGLTVGKAMNKLGRRLLLNGEIILEDVHVPARYKIEARAESIKLAEIEDAKRARPALIVCANIIGLCRCCYEETLSYARTRIQGGKPIIQHVNVTIKLAEMKIAIEAARAIVWKTAWHLEKNYNYDPQMWKLVKAFINSVSIDVATKAVDIHGGLGIDRDLPIEKYLRDAFSTLHGLGTPEISLLRGAPTLHTD